MDGVTILTTYKAGLLTGYGYFGVVFTFACIFVLSVMLINRTSSSSIESFIAAIFVIVSVVGVIAATISLIDTHTEYKITADDTVSLNELISRYEIISQDGKLFTVKEINYE